MTVDELMRHLDRLDHRERMAELIAHQRALTAADALALARALADGDVHRRWLALHVARARRDVTLAFAALDDPSLMIRRLAADVVAQLAAAIPDALLDHLDAVTLARLTSNLVRRRNAALAEAVVAGLCARERLAEAARLLPICSPAWIAARLEALAWPELVWLRLAKGRPDLLCQRIAGHFAEAERPEQVFARYGAEVWAELCERRPAIVADWIDRHVGAEHVPPQLRPGINHLVRALPARVVAWLGERPAWLAQVGLPRALIKRTDLVDDARLIPLARNLAMHRPASLASLLSRMPYPRRAALFEAATAELETARLEWPGALLAVLPGDLRDREAKRMLGLERAAIDGSWRRELLGHRILAEVAEDIERERASAQAQERGEALAALISSASRAREGFAPVLRTLHRIRNEQDPVRLAVLAALAAIPGHRFDDPEALDAVIAPIFDARDTSWATRAQASRIAHNLLIARATEPRSPMFGFGLGVLERLAGHQGTPDLPRLDRNLPRGAEQAIVEAILPWLEAARARKQANHVFRAWTALGERAWRVPELSRLLVEIIWQGQRNHAPHAAMLWLQDPRTRDERVRELVRRDRSALYLHTVVEHCHRRRQTLLVDRFATRAPRGRFHDGKVVLVPHFERGFSRWPIDLQRRYLELIAAAEREPRHFATTRAALVHLRARVPLTTVAELEGALASTDVVVHEAALGALVWLDVPAPALAILLDHLDGDRARVAMYAMPRLARVIPRARLVEALEGLLARPDLKVTVHKEALRLLGGLATPRAIELLGQAWARPLHRDVRIAAVHAASAISWSPRAWSMLEAAVTDEADVARALVEVPLANVAERHRLARLQLMLRVADHPSPDARAGLFVALTQRWAWVDPAATLAVAARVIARVDPLDPWADAIALVTGMATLASAHDAIVELIERLLELAERDVAPAGERDRLAHRRFARLIDQLEAQRSPAARPLLERAAAMLLARPDWWVAGARLDLAAAEDDRLAERVLALAASAPSTGCLAGLEAAAARSASAASLRDWSAERAAGYVARVSQGSPGARVIAARLLEGFGPRFGWGAVWTAALGRLRADDDLDVRTRARGLWM